MPKNKGNTTLIFLAIMMILVLPSLFNKSTSTTSNLPVPNENKAVKTNTTTDKTEIKTPAKTATTTKTTIKTPIIDPNLSQYSDKIQISSVNGSSNKASNEKITISNISKESINLTGFRIETYELEKFIIPKAYDLPGFSAVPEDNITLSPGGRLDIYVGTQERKMDFRENICTGYFDEKSNFGGALSHSCPIINVSKMLDFTDDCIRYLNNMPKCKMYISKMELDYKCDQFATEHYSYAGCVKDYKNDKNFYSNRWMVWMQRTTNFFRDEHELVTLKDQNGKVVDTYSY